MLVLALDNVLCKGLGPLLSSFFWISQHHNLNSVVPIYRYSLKTFIVAGETCWFVKEIRCVKFVIHSIQK